MSSILHRVTTVFPHLSSQELRNLCGELHSNIHAIEDFFQVKIKIQDNKLYLHADSTQHFPKVQFLLLALTKMANHPVSLQTINNLLRHEVNNTMNQTIQLSRKMIAARNNRQNQYLEAIDKFDITFAVGPAGTGKTYLAVSKALQAYEKGEVHRLVFVRPAVEAGEKLGFLPGDLVEKVLPYLRPIYDALYEMVGFKETQKLIQSDVIEVLPLAFMRGRTLNEAFIILDEAQNTTISQMKMFLTRIGFGSRTVVTGDMTQSDLPKGTPSGLIHALKLFKKVPEISIHEFTSKEVVRHPLVAKIIDYYEQDGKKDNE